MECPRCQTPNPATASRCLRCDTPFELDAGTLIDAPKDLPADPSLTLDNWSAAVTEPSASEAPTIGKELVPGNLLAGRYEILERLGGGGMGTVYKAKDREVDRLVALKVIRAELAGDSEILSRFKQELILARKVTHKNVIRIFDLGRASGMRFITMEYIEGQDLRSVVKEQGKPTPQRAVEILQQVCLALEAAHSEGVVHRDLKPQNIMIDKQGKVYVMDFGIARSVGSEGMTMTGALVGTPEYMSPEQVKGEDVDGRSDIFSLGIIFYDLLTGKMPYRAETVQRAMYKRTVEPATPPMVEDATVPKFLSEVTSKCLEIDSAKRYQSAQELWAELESWRTGQADEAGTVVQRWVKRKARSRGVWGAAGVAAMLIIGVVAYRHWPAPTTSTKPAAAMPSIALAVFPFRNASGDPKLDWLGTGLGDMLTNDIGQSATLRTVSQGRISQVVHDLRIKPDTSLDAGTIERLSEFTNADIVVWGEYVRIGEQLRIDATLANRKNGRQVPLKADAANEKEIFKTVDLLAKAIRDNLALSTSEVQELQSSALKPSSNSIEALRSYDQGLQLQRLGEYQGAMEAFKSSIDHDPQFALAYSRLADIYETLGHDDQAQIYSLKAVDLSQNLTQQERYLIRATHAKLLKEYPKAIEAYEALAKVSPGNTDILFALARLYEESGDLEKARSNLEKVQTLDPKFTEAVLARGRVELSSNNTQKGLEYLNTALNLAIQVGNDEQKANVLQAIGVGYEDLHRLDEALRSYQDSLEIKRRLGLKNGIAASLGAIANLQSELGKPEEALKNLNEALKVSREIGDKVGVSDLLNDLGNFNLDHGRPDQALAFYKESLQLQIDLGNEQNRALLLSNIGNIYLGRGDFQAARTYLEQALQLREKFNVPEDLADTLHNLGETNMDLGLYDQAIDQYHRALDLQRKIGNKQKVAIENSSLGTVFGYQGRYGAALSAKEEALKNYRELGEKSFWMADIQAGYGNALALTGKKAEAQTNFVEALALARDLKNQDEVAHILGFQGDNAFYTGDLKTARQYYAQAQQAAAHSTDHNLVLLAKFNMAKLGVAEGHAQASVAALTAIKDEATTSGFKYLAVQATLYLAQALIDTKNVAKAKDLLQSAMLLADKLGLLSMKAQGHVLMARALQREGKAADAELERKAAARVFDDIKAESHFDLRTRSDFAAILT